MKAKALKIGDEEHYMILFREDWQRHPNAVIHYETTNTSWLELAGLFKKMGVKNNAFHLSLLDPMLRNVDPHDANLTKDIKERVFLECTLNPWYYFREVFRVPPASGNANIKYRANRGNIATLWCVFNHITGLLLQIRQTGKSLTGDGVDSYILTCGAMNAEVSLLTKDDKLRTRTSANVKEMIMRLPPYMQTMSKKDVKNSERITIRALNNVYNLYVGQKDKKAADNLGRGMVTPFVRIDEACYVYNIQITLSTLLAATTAAMEEAEEGGGFFHTLLTTTAGKLNTVEGKYIHDMYISGVKWSEAYYDLLNLNVVKDMMNKSSNGLGRGVMILEFNHRMLGYSDAWLVERIRRSKASKDKIKVDFLLQWFNESGESPINKKLLDIIIKTKTPPKFIRVSPLGYALSSYVSEETLNSYKNKTVIIGLDTSDALGGDGDDIALVMRDYETGGVIVAGNFNETNLHSFALFLVEVMTTFKKAVLIPERRSSAMAIMDTMFVLMIEKDMNPFKRIFNWLTNNLNDDSPKEIKELVTTIKPPSLSVITKYKKQFGFATSGSGETSRGLLFGTVLRSSVKYTAKLVYDAKLIHQLSSLVLKNNRIDHAVGEHDDMVVSWLLGYWFLTFCKNKNIYGVDEYKVLNSIVNHGDLNNPDGEDNISMTYIKKQHIIKKDIEALVDRLKITENEIHAMQIMNRLKVLYSKLDKKIIRSFNLKVMLEDVKIIKNMLTI